jgi:Flp pilus assembly protein TadD
MKLTQTIPLGLIAALLAFAPWQNASAASRKSKKEEEAKKAAATEPSLPSRPMFGEKVPESQPLASFWNSPEFVKGFMGSYGFNTAIEPSFANTNEQAFYRSLAEIIGEKPEQAIAMLTTNLTAESGAILNYTLGNLHLQTGDVTNAIRQFEVSTAKFPNFRRAHKNLGLSLVKDAKYAEAIPPLTKTIELGGVDATTYGLLAFCYLNLERYVAAEAAYRNAMLLSPDTLDWKLGLVKAQVSQNKLAEADTLLNEILQEKPENDQIWKLQAGVYVQMEQPAKAAVNYEILRKLGKLDASSLMLLGDIYMTLEQRAMALPPYLEAIEKEPDRAASRGVRVADILVSRAAWDEARAMFAKVREVAGDALAEEEQLKLLKLEARVALANEEGEKAAKTLEQIAAKNPMDGEAMILLGDYYGNNGEREKAEFRYDLAAKITGFEADAMVKHAQLLVRSKDYARAVDLLTRAQKLKPRDSIGRYLEQVQRAAQASARAGRS